MNFLASRDKLLGMTIVPLMVVVLGCHEDGPPPNTATVLGTVTFGDKPVTGGMISIVSSEKRSKRATGVIRSDGTFRIAGAPLGSCKVVVDTSSMKYGNSSLYVKLPAKYAHPLDTDIIVNLQPGENRDVAIKCD